MRHHSSEGLFEHENAHDGNGGGPRRWARLAEEAVGAAAMIGAALAVDALDRPRRGRAVAARAPYVGSPRFLWTSIAALGLIGRGRRDPAVLRTAAKLAVAVGAAQGLARMHPGRVSERAAAAWAAAGVLEREQGKGPGLAAYGGAALTGFPRDADGRHPVADAVIGAVVGRIVGRLVGRLRIS